MPAQAGKNLLLKVESPAASATYITLGGLRTKTYTWANEAIDVTNHGSNENRELLNAAGVRSMSISGSGVHDGDAATLNLIEDALQTGVHQSFQIVDVSAGGRTYTGNFKVVSFERGAEHSAEQTYSISIESSGAITIS
jgi:TP901-1 family phage major tail protein